MSQLVLFDKERVRRSDNGFCELIGSDKGKEKEKSGGSEGGDTYCQKGFVVGRVKRKDVCEGAEVGRVMQSCPVGI
jgi:hypothetical protein